MFEKVCIKLREAVEKLDLRLSVAALTLFLVNIFGFEDQYSRIVARTVLVAVLLWPHLLRSPILWFAISAASTLALISDWSTADNHKYLLVYWLWVVTFSCAEKENGVSEKVLGVHARFFVIFVFLAAALQKMSSPTYLSGEMFENKLFLDPRFQAFSHIMGVDRQLTDAARLSASLLISPFNEFENNAVLLPASAYSRRLALAITWYDLLVQVGIGLFFSLRLRVTDLIGHALLLFFIFTTYLPAPVYGFGVTIAIYGFTLSKERFPAIGGLYLISVIVILLYVSPWRTWVLGG